MRAHFCETNGPHCPSLSLQQDGHPFSNGSPIAARWWYIYIRIYSISLYTHKPLFLGFILIIVKKTRHKLPTLVDSRIWSSGVFRSLRIARAIRREKMVRGLFRITQGTLGLDIDVGCYRNRPIEGTGYSDTPPKVNGWNWKFGGLRVHVAPFFLRGHSYRLHVFGGVVRWFSSFSFWQSQFTNVSKPCAFWWIFSSDMGNEGEMEETLGAC